MRYFPRYFALVRYFPRYFNHTHGILLKRSQWPIGLIFPCKIEDVDLLLYVAHIFILATIHQITSVVPYMSIRQIDRSDPRTVPFMLPLLVVVESEGLIEVWHYWSWNALTIE